MCVRIFWLPQGGKEEENVQGWAEDRLRKTEKQQDTVATFKRRVHPICKQYPGGAKLVPGLARLMTLCIQRKGGANRKVSACMHVLALLAS